MRRVSIMSEGATRREGTQVVVIGDEDSRAVEEQ